MKIELLNVEFDPSKPISKVKYDSNNIRIVVFSIPQGLEISPHKNPSNVLLYCAKGEGKFLKGNAWIDVREGDMVACEPLELHGMKADKDMIVIASIAPSPKATNTKVGL